MSEKTTPDDIFNRLSALSVLFTRFVIETALSDENLTKKEYEDNESLLKSLMYDYNTFLDEHGEIFTPGELLAMNLPSGTWTQKEFIYYSWMPEFIGVLKWISSLNVKMPDYNTPFEYKDINEKDIIKIRDMDLIDKEIDALMDVYKNKEKLNLNYVTRIRILCRLKTFEWFVRESDDKTKLWDDLSKSYAL